MSPSRGGRAVLCADVGTSSLKAALVDADGACAAFAREPYRPAFPAPAGSPPAPVAAADWEAAFRRACAALAAEARSAGIGIAAVCVSGNGPTLVPVAADGSALPVLHWHDGRAAALPPSGPRPPSFFLPRAAWLRDADPAAFGRVRTFLSCHEWLSARLGADEAGVLPTPAYRPYFWDAGQIAAWGLDPALFPPLAVMGDRIGSVSARAAAEFGLPAGIPIVAAATDFFMALVGVGAVREGMACDRAGTSEGINVCAAKPARAPGLLTLPQLRDGLWHVSAMLPTTGRLFEWFRTITGQETRGYREMMDEIAGAAPRAFGPGAAAAGSFFFPDVRATGGLSSAGAFISTAGLTTRAELGRSVVEAIGFMVRRAIGDLESHGYRVEGLRLSGGQSKNDAWNRLKADMTGRYLSVMAIEDGELAGNACAAWACLGEADGIEEAIGRVVRVVRVWEPDREAYARHSERYDAYEALLAKMEKFLS